MRTPGGQSALLSLRRMRLPGNLADHVEMRLRKGAEEYGDDSLRRSQDELLDEIREEALDVIGWTAVLMVRKDLWQLPGRLARVVALAEEIAAAVDECRRTGDLGPVAGEVDHGRGSRPSKGLGR